MVVTSNCDHRNAMNCQRDQEKFNNNSLLNASEIIDALSLRIEQHWPHEQSQSHVDADSRIHSKRHWLYHGSSEPTQTCKFVNLHHLITVGIESFENHDWISEHLLMPNHWPRSCSGAAQQSCRRTLRLTASRNEMTISHAHDWALPFQKTPLPQGAGMFAFPELRSTTTSSTKTRHAIPKPDFVNCSVMALPLALQRALAARIFMVKVRLTASCM